MSFNSLHFIIFFPVVLLLYWILPSKFRWALLLVASYYFYMSWNIWLGFLILGTTLISYLAARFISVSQKRGVRIFLLTLTLIICLGCLVVFKYLDFIIGNALSLIRLFGGTPNDITLNLILPVGISFYTFQTLSYVIDVYREKVPAEKHFGYYALYVSFFPQLVAGPIERPENLLPQLREAHKLNAEDMESGLRLFISGFCKKVVIADLVASAVDSVYSAHAQANGFAVLAGTVLFAIQIYCDFSGYSEIAMGAARMMGIRLMRNFDSPYLALGIRDFWRRWHISLTLWFTDYLYIPLGGNRKGAFRRCLNTMLVFLVSGLWHGANWTFVIWGALHGCYLVAEFLLAKPWNALLSKLKIKKENIVYRGFMWLITFVLVCFAWIFFRAGSLSDAGVLIARLFTAWDGNVWTDTVSLFGLNLYRLILLPLSAILLIALRRLSREEKEGKPQPVSVQARQALLYFLLITAIIIAWFIALASGVSNNFIYFQF